MDYLYKFLTADRATYLTDGLLRFTQPICLNDPFECLPIATIANFESYIHKVTTDNMSSFRFAFRDCGLTDEQIFESAKELARQKYKSSSFLTDYFIERFKQYANADDGVGIFSLSRRYDSLLMWSHYAYSHTGFCIGFDRKHAFFERQPSDHIDVGMVIPVKYDANRYEVEIDNFVFFPTDLFYKKASDWHYEEEERLVRYLINATEIRPEPQGKYLMYLFKVPHSAITEIILGANCSEDLKGQILEFGRKHGKPVWQSIISNKKYDMERKQLA